MSQELLDNGLITAATPGWEAILNNNITKLLNYIKTVFMQVTPIAGGSQVYIQFRNADNSHISTQELLRVRVSDAGAFNVTSDAGVFITVLNGSIVESYTAGKDVLIKTGPNGLCVVNVSYPSGSYRLNIGPSVVNTVFANYHNYAELV